MILVTGGTGMLGAHLLYSLLKAGKDIRAIKRKNSNVENVRRIFNFYDSESEKEFLKIEWFDADLLDKESIFQSMLGIEKVYHTAAMVSFNPKDRDEMIENNVKGTANLVNAALGNKVSRFCHVSSISALGNADAGNKTTEDTFRNPKEKYSAYSLSKFYSELEVWRGITEGLDAVILNPSVILGPGNWKSGSPSIFSTVWKGLKFYTSGITGYVDVFDVVMSMIQLMESDIKNERFIVSAEDLSFKELFSMVADGLNVKKPSVEAKSFLLTIAWIAEYLRSRVSNNPPMITKETASSAMSETMYSSEKLIKTLNFKFTPISVSISRIAEIFKKDMMER